MNESDFHRFLVKDACYRFIIEFEKGKLISGKFNIIFNRSLQMQNRKNPFSSTPAIYRNAKQKRPAKKKNTAAAGKIKFNGIFSREYLSFCQHLTRNKTKKAIAKASIRKP